MGSAARRSMATSMNEVLLRVGGVPEHFNLPWRRASKTEAITWREFPGGSGAMSAALQAGELDCAVMLTEAIVAEVSKGAPFKLLGAYTSSPLTWGVHAHAARVKEAGWSPRKVAVSRLFSGSHLMALVDAKQRGLPLPEDFVVVGSLDGARDALAKGTADVFMWELYTTKFLVDGGEWVRIGEVPTPWPCFSIAVADAVAQNQERTAAVLNVLAAVRANADALKSSETGAAEIAGEYGLLEPDVRDWIRTVVWCSRPEMPSSILATVSASLRDAGVLRDDELRAYDSLVVPGVTVDKALA